MIVRCQNCGTNNDIERKGEPCEFCGRKLNPSNARMVRRERVAATDPLEEYR